MAQPSELEGCNLQVKPVLTINIIFFRYIPHKKAACICIANLLHDLTFKIKPKRWIIGLASKCKIHVG